MKDVEGETLGNFSPIVMTEKDEKLRECLFQDGLKEELEWVTVPDLFETQWPFAKRFPGRRCPPDLLLESLPKQQQKA
jgi:hypothetical protein